MIYEAGSNLFKMASLLDRDLGAHLQEGDETLLHSLLLEVIGSYLKCDEGASSIFSQFGFASLAKNYHKL